MMPEKLSRPAQRPCFGSGSAKCLARVVGPLSLGHQMYPGVTSEVPQSLSGPVDRTDLGPAKCLHQTHPRMTFEVSESLSGPVDRIGLGPAKCSHQMHPRTTFEVSENPFGPVH